MQKHLVTFTLLGLLLTRGFAQPRLVVEPRAVASAPVRLTSSDGVGMRLTRYEAKVVVQGPLAFTELHLRFHNPQDRVLEGRFSVTLPEGAALSRLAMKNDQGWQEAEVVELQAARVAYEDFLHRRQDPALLEKQAGNEFQARIFPLPAGGDKELILSYSQEVTGDYRLPVGGLPKVEELAVHASVGGQKLDYSLHGESPKGDLVIQGKQSPAGMTNGEDALVVVKPQVASARAESNDLVVLVDTSASRAAGYAAQVRKVRDLLTEWKRRHPGARIRLAAFDQEVVPMEGVDQLTRRRPLGATDLARALRWASAQDIARVVLVSDGVSTAGADQLTANHRLDALMVGGIRETAVLQPLANGHGGFVLDGESSVTELATRLEGKPASGVTVQVSGADWVWPPVLNGVAPGEARVVYAHMRQPAQEVKVTLGGAPAYTQSLSNVSRPLLHRSLVAANLARLNQQRLKATGQRKAEIARHMVELSTGNRVVCDLTGLLVLETEADYQRFKINRNALAQILVAGDTGIEVQDRKEAVVSATPPPKTEPTPEKLEAKDEEKSVEDDLKQDDGKAAPPSTGASLYLQNTAGSGQASADQEESDGLAGAVDTRRAPAAETGRVPASAPAPARERLQQSGPFEVVGNAPQGVGAFQDHRTRRRATVGEENRGRRIGEDTPVSANTETTASRDQRTVPNPEPSEPSNDSDGDEAAPPLSGNYQKVDTLLRHGKVQQALLLAQSWQAKEPGDVLALVALGRSLQASGQLAEAARAYGSIIDLFPGRADLRRYAGGLLESLGKTGQGLANDSYRQSVQQRPDHPSGSRMLAYNLLRQGSYEKAFEVLEKAFTRNYPGGRFAEVESVLSDDLGMVAAAIVARDPDQRPRMIKKLHALGVPLANKPSLRFVLTWETDANDVDFHIKDGKGGHAYYSQPELASGGRLYGDVTTGYGPECFNIPGGGRAFPYNISIHYYSRGPMGYGMGKVEILRHDGKGHFRFEQRPFVVMNDNAFVQLGQVKD